MTHQTTVLPLSDTAYWLWEYQKAIINVRGLILRGQSETAVQVIDDQIARWRQSNCWLSSAAHTNAKLVAEILTQYGLDCSSPDQSLDDVEQERWNACCEVAERVTAAERERCAAIVRDRLRFGAESSVPWPADPADLERIVEKIVCGEPA